MTATWKSSVCTARKGRSWRPPATRRRSIASSRPHRVDRIESIVGDEQIACDFVRLDGYLFVPLGESSELLDRELSTAHRAGLSGVERLARAPLLPLETGPCLRFPRQAQFDPLKYLTAVAGALQRAGGRYPAGQRSVCVAVRGVCQRRLDPADGRMRQAASGDAGIDRLSDDVLESSRWWKKSRARFSSRATTGGRACSTTC